MYDIVCTFNNLGSVAKSGWFRQPNRFVPPSKRHIGSLARLGWLPSFRTARRFNRSGRSTNSCDNRFDFSSPKNGVVELFRCVEFRYILPKLYKMHAISNSNNPERYFYI